MSNKKLLAALLGLLLLSLPLILFAVSNKQNLRQHAAELTMGIPPGYTMVWEDQFESTSLDQSTWNYFVGQGKTPDINFIKESVSITNGILNIKTYTENENHYSGWITTENKYHPQYGYIEARIDFEPVDKLGMAFWLFHPLVNAYGDPWNNGIEMDIVEYGKTDYLGNDVSNMAMSNLNWGRYGADWDNHPSIGSGHRGSGLADGFHTYSMEWTPEHQRYYIDGQYLWEVKNSTVSPVSRRDEFLVLSHHPGGGAVNYGSKTNSSAKMKVDYVRVYQLNPTAPPPPTNVTKIGGSGSTAISWDISANATKYNIKRSSIANGPYTTVGTTKELTYTDSTANPSGEYFYVVTALNSTGESRNSTEIKVIPNIARGKTATASSVRQAAANALDADAVSFWESDWATDPQWITIDLQAYSNVDGVVLNWEHAYAKSYRIETSTDGANWTSVYSTDNGNGGIDEIGFQPIVARYVRMYGTQRAHTYATPSPFGYAIKEFEVYSGMGAPTPTGLKGFTNKESVKLSWNPAPSAASYNVKRSNQNGGPYTVVATGLITPNYIDRGLTNEITYFHVVTAVNSAGESANSNEVRTIPHSNLALWQQTYASSKENADTRPYKAVDGKTATFAGMSTSWASEASDPQWISIDLQTTYPVNRVLLDWAQHAREYEIQTSLNNVDWKPAYSTSSGDGKIDDISFSPIDARYVRMYGKQRGTMQRYSLNEFEVYASSSTVTPSNAPTPTPSPTIEQPTPTPTTTASPESTSVTISLLLHGLGKGGDSANPNSGGNMSPLRKQRDVQIELFNNQNKHVLSTTGKVNYDLATGTFTGSVDVGAAIPTGLYSIKIKSDQFLKKIFPGIQNITQGTSNPIPQATLINGDTNNDNKIDILDYSIIIDCYSDIAPAQNCADSTKKTSADITDDGVVDQFDYNLFLRELTNITGE